MRKYRVAKTFKSLQKKNVHFIQKKNKKLIFGKKHPK